MKTPISVILYLLLYAVGFSETYTITDLDYIPKRLEGRMITRPSDPKFKDFAGSVTLRYIIDEKGRVRDSEVMFSDHVALSRGALQVASTWRYEIPKVNGRPVKVEVFEKVSIGKFPFIKKASEIDSPIEVRRFVKPYFPAAMRRKGEEGVVKLEAMIYPNGTAKVRRVVEASDVGFIVDAIRSIERTVYTKPTFEGSPCRVKVIVPVKFNISDADQSEQDDL